MAGLGGQADTNLILESEWRLFITPERGWDWDTWRAKAAECGTILSEHPEAGYFLMVKTSDVAL